MDQVVWAQSGKELTEHDAYNIIFKKIGGDIFKADEIYKRFGIATICGNGQGQAIEREESV